MAAALGNAGHHRQDRLGPPDWFAACAASEEPELRRVAATWPGLPAMFVDALAQDDDEEVRILLACHQPLAPPHLLLDVFVTRRTHRPHLLTMPAPPVDDPNESVRRAAAADPSLTPQTLEALLADPRTAEGAAANPSLPIPRMHALLDRCLKGATTPTTATRHRETTPT
ncbi:hypothetical protein GCM10010347_52020 [Streptomyces cirratus]|uniref:Leucine rich repeat variant n=1 Tax=Streptomyces cirratus TaxID=68187 RepID=A0ABQ3F2S1_9ACTN|nr:hypothetical protein [Streptomyces cirratus]GHB75257.1 hypothetical protein GCM10010347_52020 [Streptomyces cirratus]